MHVRRTCMDQRNGCKRAVMHASCNRLVTACLTPKRVFFVLKAHPDKGGSDDHAKQLSAAKDLWDKARRPAGRPKKADAGGSARQTPSSSGFGLTAEGAELPNDYRIGSQGVC